MPPSGAPGSGPGHSPSGEGLVEDFLSTFENRQTRRNYRTDLTQFFGEEGANRERAAQVEEKDVLGFLREQASSLAPSTLARKVETLRSFFGWLKRRGLVGEVPIDDRRATTDLVEEVRREIEEDTSE